MQADVRVQSSVATIVTVNALPATPVITADGPTTFCAGGSVTLTSSAETNYLWSDGETTPSINVNSTGTFTIRVINTNGCQSVTSAATSVIVNPLPVTPTITSDGPTTFCDGGNVSLSAGAGTSYLWSNGSSTASINITKSGSLYSSDNKWKRMSECTICSHNSNSKCFAGNAHNFIRRSDNFL